MVPAMFHARATHDYLARSVIGQIIPLLPLRDPTNMTPQSARDALSALAASRAAVPPPPVMSAEDIKVKGAAGFLAARVYRNTNDKSPTVVFSMAAAGLPAISTPMTGRRAFSPSRPAPSWSRSIIAARPRCAFRRLRGCLRGHRDVIARIAEFGGDVARVGVAGDSAGGNLAATTAIACRDAGIKLSAQLLVYPVTDVAGISRITKKTRASLARRRTRRAISSRAVMEWFCGHYLADTADGTDWRVSAAARQKSRRSRARRWSRLAWFDPLARRGQGVCATRPEGRRRSDQLLRRPRPDPRLFRPQRSLRDRQARSATGAGGFQDAAGKGA